MNKRKALPGFRTLAGLLTVMGKKKNTEHLEPDRFYHVFNRGINGEKIFSIFDNYFYFLKLLQKYILPIAKVYSYCLLPNHFHFLVQIKSEKEIRDFITKPNFDITFIVSKQFSNFFNAYSQAYNKSFNRTGRLFEQPFRRIHINTEEYLIKTILYIHKNPRKHSIEENIAIYRFSSYHDIITGKSSFIQSEEVIKWFEDLDNFIYCHQNY